MDSDIKQGPAALLLAAALVLTFLGVFAVVHPQGDFKISNYQTPTDITLSKESGRTVVTRYPDSILLGNSGPLSRYTVTFSNPLVAEYATYHKGTTDYPALIPQNLGRTEVTIVGDGETIKLVLVIKAPPVLSQYQ